MADPFAGVASPVMQDGDPFAGIASPVITGSVSQSPDFLKRMGSDIDNRISGAQEANDAYLGKQQSAGSTGLQIAGQGFGLIGDTVANALGSVARSAYDIAVPHAGQIAQAQELGAMKNYLKGSDVANAAGNTAGVIGKGLNYLNQNYPVSMKDAGAIGNIATALPAADLLGNAASATGKTADTLYQASKDAFQAKRLAGAQNVVLPKATPSQMAEDALKYSSGGGVLNKTVYIPNTYEADMIKTAAEAGVKPSVPLIDNIQTLNTAKNAEAQKLKFTLDKANVSIPPATLNQAGVTIAQQIAANPLVDENSATVRKILETAQKVIDDNPKTAAGVLQARKDFDAAITQFQPSALDTDAPATAFRYTAKQVRQGMNGVIADAVPNGVVRDSLAKQSHMYDAIDNMAGKLSQQPDNRFGRFFDTKTGKVIKYGAAATGATAAGRAAFNYATPQVPESYSGDN